MQTYKISVFPSETGPGQTLPTLRCNQKQEWIEARKDNSDDNKQKQMPLPLFNYNMPAQEQAQSVACHKIASILKSFDVVYLVTQ